MKQLTVLNCTEDIVLCQSGNGAEHQVVLPSRSNIITIPIFRSTLTLTPQSTTAKSNAVDEKWSIAPNTFTIRLPMALGTTWKTIKVADDCPWRIYRTQISYKHQKLVIIPRRNLSSFLEDMPDSLPLSSLLLPGTHDTMALYGWPVSQCQSLSTPLAVQLQSGIRVLDIRLAVKKSRLIAYHGLFPQRVPFQDILSTVHSFLLSPSTCCETIVMSIKQEDFTTTAPADFSKLVHEEIMAGPGGRDMWFLENKIPSLGQVRGKVVMFSRFGGDGDGWEGGLEGIGIHPTRWPDSEKWGFTWDCKNTLVRTHDWYNIPSFLSIPEKTELAARTLLPPPNDPPMPTQAISFFSAASFPLAVPPTVARGIGWPQLGFGVQGVNARLGSWLLNQLSQGAGKPCASSEEPETDPKIRGWALLDFYRDPEKNSVVPLLIECNYRGRKSGQEGWPDNDDA